MQLDDGAAQQLHVVRSRIFLVANQGGRALREVDLKAGGAPKQLQDALDGTDVTQSGVAEEDHVVCVEGDRWHLASQVLNLILSFLCCTIRT